MSTPLSVVGALPMVMLAAVMIAACGTSSNTPAVTGDLGGSGSSLPAAEDLGTNADMGTNPADAEIPRRIISLSPTATEILFAIGAGSQVVAVDSLSNYPKEAPTSDLSAFEPNLEALAAEDPDLVVLSYDPGGIVDGLQVVGIETLLQPGPVTLDDVYAQIADLGVATGQVDGAAELVARMRGSIEDIVASAPAGAQPLRVYHEIDSTFYSASSGSFIGQLYSLLGVVNIADEADSDGSGYPQLSPEYIIEADPQLIVIPGLADYTATDVAERPGWGIISAVRNDAVIAVNDDISSRWGPRIVDFLEIISSAVASQQVDA